MMIVILHTICTILLLQDDAHFIIIILLEICFQAKTIMIATSINFHRWDDMWFNTFVVRQCMF